MTYKFINPERAVVPLVHWHGSGGSVGLTDSSKLELVGE